MRKKAIQQLSKEELTSRIQSLKMVSGGSAGIGLFCLVVFLYDHSNTFLASIINFRTNLLFVMFLCMVSNTLFSIKQIGQLKAELERRQ